MANIDDTTPTDSSLISQFPSNERSSRTQIKAFIGEEHDETSERHKFVVGDHTARAAITNWQTGSIFFSTQEVSGKKVLQFWDGTAWITDMTQLIDVLNTWTKPQHGEYKDLGTLSGNIASDWNDSNFFEMTLNGATSTLLDPTNIPSGTPKRAGTWLYVIRQDGAGSRVLSYGAKFHFQSGVTPTLSTGANDTDLLYCTLKPDGNIHAVLVRKSS